MDLNEKVLMNFRIPRGLKLKFETAAKGHGKSATGFVQQIMEFASFTDPEFFDALMKLAEKHQWIVEQSRLEERRKNVE